MDLLSGHALNVPLVHVDLTAPDILNLLRQPEGKRNTKGSQSKSAEKKERKQPRIQSNSE